ncbi:MAG: hypothetical protein GSR80_000875 [Desulfurococcales archaeon]|nr:hypothetical protein [Desulfurococcales archaeon]
MLVVIEAGPEWGDSAERLRRLAERLGYRVVVRRVERGFRVESPAGVYEDPDRASVALARLAVLVGGGSG